MDSIQIKALLDSCFVAKNITETMKELPKGFKPRHIHIIDTISRLSGKNVPVRVSDVSHQLNVTTPSVTKLINELEEKGVVEKYELPGDKRAALLRLTAAGKEYELKYVVKYHARWAENMKEVSEEDVAAAIRVIHKLAGAMPKGEADE